jgi:hypothetical protein
VKLSANAGPRASTSVNDYFPAANTNR